MPKQKLRIILGDPRHNTIGRHSTYLPVALGYIANYTMACVGSEGVDFSLHSDTNELIDTIEKDIPDVIGLTNYCWNAELSKMILSYAKELEPDVVCVGGGAEFPKTQDEVLAYMHYRSELDFYITQEGEYSFAKLIGNILKGLSIEQLKSEPQHGIYSLHPQNGNLVFGSPQLYIEDLDSIPSPFLTGILDKFLDGKHVPFLESLRGCPYACTYCHEGVRWRNKIRGFSKKRICAELDYITLQLKDFPDIPLAMADSNFGMYKRDEEIAAHLCKLEEQYHWPRSFIVDTGKTQIERIIRVALKLNKRMSMSISPQSFNKKTLKAIKRTNIGGDRVEDVYAAMKKLGISTNAGIILQL